MVYIYKDAEKLEGLPPVGSKQCVALVQKYANAPQTSLWTQGVTVNGATNIEKGTAIATFVGGKYPNHASGNHAAFYIKQDTTGVWVIDQWSTSKTIRKRCLRFKGTKSDGSFIDAVNNGDAFSVIEK